MMCDRCGGNTVDKKASLAIGLQSEETVWSLYECSYCLYIETTRIKKRKDEYTKYTES